MKAVPALRHPNPISNILETILMALLPMGVIYTLGIRVLRTLAFTVGFLAEAVLVLAIFRII